MEGNFETNGGSSSMPINQAGQSFDSFQDEVGASKMTWQDYLKDGVDKGYYKAETEGIFSMDEVMSESQEKMESFDQEIMDIPGDAHEKLEALAEMDSEEEEVVQNKEEASENKKDADLVQAEFKDAEGLSFEQRVIELQAEALRSLAKSMNEKGKGGSNEELLKKLEELMKEIGKSESKNKVSLMQAVFGVILLFATIAEKGTDQLEKEVKNAQ